jgi:nitroreductase
MTGHPRTSAQAVLGIAARRSMRAPSVFNTQPWHWQISGDTAALRVDPDRRLDVTDPDGRLLMLSLGAALHHAEITIRAEGWHVLADRLPDPSDPTLIARLRIGGYAPTDDTARRLSAAIAHRRTDRRAFGDRTVPDALLGELRRAVEAQGAYLHVVRPEQVPVLAAATARAAADERDEDAYRAELDRWTHRPLAAGDGVPATMAVRQSPRRVPVRDFAPGAPAGLEPGTGHDAGAGYVILFGTADDPADRLRGGEALSALLLNATAAGLATAPMSEAVELDWPRQLLTEMLDGVGKPYLVVRLGFPVEDAGPLPAAARREPDEVIDYPGS